MVGNHTLYTIWIYKKRAAGDKDLMCCVQGHAAHRTAVNDNYPPESYIFSEGVRETLVYVAIS